MKRVFALALTAMMLVGVLCVSVFAAGSTSLTVEPPEKGTLKDGTSVDVIIKDESTPLLTVEEASKISGVDASKLAILWQKDVTTSVAPTAENPASLTFHVNGAKDIPLYVFHWTGSEWEIVGEEDKIADVTGTFTSLSPVAIVRATAEAGSDAPVTGAIGLTAAAIVAVLGCTGACVAVTKKH